MEISTGPSEACATAMVANQRKRTAGSTRSVFIGAVAREHSRCSGGRLGEIRRHLVLIAVGCAAGVLPRPDGTPASGAPYRLAHSLLARHPEVAPLEAGFAYRMESPFQPFRIEPR